MRTFAIILALSASLLAQSAAPQTSPSAPPGHSILGDPNKFADAHVNSLDRVVTLTDQQRPKVRAIFFDEAQRLGKIMTDQSITDEKRQNSLQSLHLATMHRVAMELTPEQREKYWGKQPPPKRREPTVQN